MIICLGLTPAVQRVMIFNRLHAGGVNRAVEVVESIAGKAVNVAKVLAALGQEVLATGFAGGDRGQFVLDELAKAGVRHDFVSVQPRTRMCVTLIDRGADVHTELVEESRPVEAEAFAALRSKLHDLLKQARFLTLSGTLTPGAPQDFYYACIRMAHAAGVPCILDATGAALTHALPAGPQIAKPNRSELASTLALPTDSPSALRGAMQRLLESGARSVVVTMGAEGAMATDGRSFWRIGVPKLQVVNSIGSGDSFTAGMAAALVRGQSFPEACRLGAACACANALNLLAGDVHPDHVAQLLTQIRVEAL